MLELAVTIELRNLVKELERLGYDVVVTGESSYYDNHYQTFEITIHGVYPVHDESKSSNTT